MDVPGGYSHVLGHFVFLRNFSRECAGKKLDPEVLEAPGPSALLCQGRTFVPVPFLGLLSCLPHTHTSTRELAARLHAHVTLGTGRALSMFVKTQELKKTTAQSRRETMTSLQRR